jgi:hypothetical protein
MNRLANRLAPSHTFTYVDDFFEAGTFTDTISTDEAIIYETVDKVLGPEGLSVKKNVDAQITDILGILINFLSATMRPKDTAIEKLFFVRAIQHRYLQTANPTVLAMPILLGQPILTGHAWNAPIRCPDNVHDPPR